MALQLYLVFADSMAVRRDIVVFLRILYYGIGFSALAGTVVLLRKPGANKKAKR